MVALTALGFFSSNESFLKLSACSLATVLLLAGVTVAAVLWAGP